MTATIEEVRTHELTQFRWLPMGRSGGRHRAGFVSASGQVHVSLDSDPTHVRFVDFDAVERMCVSLGVVVQRRYSFPFPRWAGKVFAYNEFVVVAQKP